MKDFKKNIGKLSIGRCLDVGTRNGEFLIKLRDNVKEYTELVGIDNNQEVVQKSANNINLDNIHIMLMDACNMTFKDNSFDTVCLSNTIHHLSDSKRYYLFKEMIRVLKPGGYIIINEMFRDNQNKMQLTHLYMHHLLAEIDTLLGKTHYDTLKKQDIIDIVKATGVKIFNSFEYQETEAFKHRLVNKLKNIDNQVEKVKDFPEYEYIKQRAELIKQRFNIYGLSPCTELIVIGQK